MNLLRSIGPHQGIREYPSTRPVRICRLAADPSPSVHCPDLLACFRKTKSNRSLARSLLRFPGIEAYHLNQHRPGKERRWSLGYTLSSEEQAPRDSVKYAVRAEELGFEFVSISDHFHPWIPEQPHSPFVWSTIGGVAMQTKRIPAGHRRHLPDLPHAPGDHRPCRGDVTGAMMEGRFYLGPGDGRKPERTYHRRGMAGV